jgi:hypothetical protein
MRHRRRPNEKPPAPSHLDLIPSIREKLPCLYFDFSRKACQKKATELATKKDKKETTSFPSIRRSHPSSGKNSAKRLPRSTG